jgi:hypothetical protein
MHKFYACFIWLYCLLMLVSCGYSPSNITSTDVYILNNYSGIVTTCRLSSDGSLSLCQNATNYIFNQPNSIIINKGIAYISTQTSGIFSCNVGIHQLTNCSLMIADGSFPVQLAIQNNILYTTDFSSGNVVGYNLSSLSNPISLQLGVNQPVGIAFYNNSTVFIVTQNYTNTSITTVPSIIFECQVDLATGVISGCNNVYSFNQALLGIAIQDNKLFVTNAEGNSLLGCDITNNQLVNCQNNTSVNLFNYPFGATIINGQIYVPNYGESSITRCPTDNIMDNCIKQSSPVFNGVTWIAASS